MHYVRYKNITYLRNILIISCPSYNPSSKFQTFFIFTVVHTSLKRKVRYITWKQRTIIEFKIKWPFLAPPKGCMTLTWWWGLCVSVIHQDIPAVACYWQGLPCRAGWWWEARRRSTPSILQDCWGLIVGLITPHRKTITITKPYMPWNDGRRQLRKRNMEIRFVTWNVRTLFKAGSLKALTQQLQKYEIQITAVQETK
jgi:hypothetical protein